jgi:hypothetical protein
MNLNTYRSISMDRQPDEQRAVVRFWYMSAGAACILMGVGAFFVPAIVHLEASRGTRVEAQVAVCASEHGRGV